MDGGEAGIYVAEVTAGRGADELGRDVMTFERTDGVAENFHTEQNRDLLEKLSAQTGGRYWKAEELGRLPKRDLVLGGGDLGAGYEGALGYADRVSGAAGVDVGGVAAAAEVGCGMRLLLGALWAADC